MAERYSLLDGFALVLGVRSRWGIRLVNGAVAAYVIASLVYGLVVHW